MRIIFLSDERVKRCAKTLKKISGDYDLDIRLTEAQNVMAMVFGYRNYQHLRSMLGASPPSLMDGNIDPEEAVRRRDFQVASLAAALEIGTDIASKIIEEIGPTAGGRRVDDQLELKSMPPVVVVRKNRALSGLAPGRRLIDLRGS